jgi:hypothetical protein
MAIGQFVFAFFTIMFLIPSLPAMIEEGNKLFPNQNSEVTNMSSGAFNSIIMSGTGISVIYGSYITKEFGFRNCADSVGIITIAYSLLYFTLIIVFNKNKPGETDIQTKHDLKTPLLE